MVDADASLPLPWLDEPLGRALRQGAHALLVHGPEGIGQFELGLTLAKAWLCEGTAEQRSHGAGCGVCRSCHLIEARSHPDLLVLIPELLRESLGWAGESEEGGWEKGSKSKPSKEIKVEAVRTAVSFAQTTSARGRGKVLVLHPAERMNAVAANTLLKTLEEPPGNARFVLSSAAPDSLLPTIRSRCQAVPLVLPPQDAAAAWLSKRNAGKSARYAELCGQTGPVETRPRPFTMRSRMTSKNSRDTIAPGVIVVSPVPTTTGAGPAEISAIALKLRVPSFQSLKLGSDTLPLRAPVLSI